MFKRLVTSLDNKLYKMFDPPVQHCDGCGEEYPMYYLTHVNNWDGDYCKRCMEFTPPEEGYKAYCGLCASETTHIGVHCQECEY